MNEVKRVAEEIKAKAGSNGIDYLVTTQGACSAFFLSRDSTVRCADMSEYSAWKVELTRMHPLLQVALPPASTS